ncbi:MAG: ParB/RepB/Spo0J family partition protein [Deltaproteobacteria bacterium]|nr:ParB/RepB/Spo0J family partition protein [Deltaproteobacteria bacterium]MBW2672506.1 ParB/RepB/Spo0J family partition protein [Deltaproteobacteria bacterium]
MSTTIKLPIDAIKIPEVRASSKLTPEQLEFFKATVDAVGVIQDPVVRQVEPGVYELVAGKTRLEELKARGETEVSVKVIDADERTALFMHLAENLARGSIDYISAAKVMAKAKALGSSISEISKVMGKSETWVRRTLALLDLPEHYQEAIAEGKLTPTHIYLAAKMPTTYEMDDALRSALTHGWNTSVFETFVSNRLAQLEAARREAVEKGVEYTPPPVEPEKLISYKQCLLCGYRVPADKVTVQMVCEGCQELAAYITSQLGPWENCKETVFNALSLYFGMERRPQPLAWPSKTEASQE